MSRTKNSNYAIATKKDNNEKAINLKFGKDSEHHFIPVLNNNFPNYKWYAFKNNFESVDFYGIPNQEELYNVKDNYYKYDGSLVEIVIELKTKRLLCNAETHKLAYGVKSINEPDYTDFFHFVNWSKYEDIKKRFNKGQIKKAFLVWDYLKTPCENKLSEYDHKTSGDYYFHEITKAKIYSDTLREEYEDHTSEPPRYYNEGWYQNHNREVEDKVLRIANDQVLPFKYFKYFLNDWCEGGDNNLACELFNNNQKRNAIRNKKIKKTHQRVKQATKNDNERRDLLFKYGVYKRGQIRKRQPFITFEEYYNENSEW